MRHKTHIVDIGGVKIGGNNPIIVQSMTDTSTADIIKTSEQILALVNAGSEIVRLTINNKEAASSVVKIKENLVKQGINTPLVGCFHYNGHSLLQENPDCAKALAKYRINPGNVGFGQKQDLNYTKMIELALKYDKPVRIGVNWGSLDKALSARLMDENATSKNPKPIDEVLQNALVESVISSAKRAEEIGLAANKIVVSCKVSRVADLVKVYNKLAQKSNYAMHLGLTEAGMGRSAVIASSAALAILLNQGIGDTIRISLTPEPDAPRTEEVIVAKEILQSLGLRSFVPTVTSCPGCGRTTSSYFRKLTKEIQEHIKESMPIWKNKYHGVEKLKIAVMGCIVNGPGESKHADIGISLPGSGEDPVAPVFIDGQKAHTLRGDNIASEFKQILENYINNKYLSQPVRQSFIES